MAAQTTTNIKNLVDATVQWHRIFASDRTRLHFNPEFVSELEVFVGEARMIRWGLLATEEKVAEIWQSIMPGTMPQEEGTVAPAPARINENIVDYVLNGTAYIKMMADMATAHAESTINDIAHNLCWPYKAMHIDGDLKDRAADPEFLKEVFTKTAWVLFVYLISISPLEFDEGPLVFGPTLPKGETDK
jgi:hypothetical protein